MSKFKPIFRELEDALKSAGHALGPLPDGIAGKLGRMSKHSDTEVRGLDDGNFALITTRGGNQKVTICDAGTGRPISEYGVITEDFGSLKRGDGATDIGNRYGLDSDDGGHLGAHRFFGDTPDGGIVPQDSNLNRGPWRTMESEWADWTAADQKVVYSVNVDPPGVARPDNFGVQYSVTDPDTGAQAYRRDTPFVNESGQSFDRVPKADIPGWIEIAR